MRLKKVIEAEDAVAVIHDGDVIASAGYGGNGTPDQLFVALEKHFLEAGAPRDLTLVFAGGHGDMKDKGLNRLGHAGLLKRVIGGHFGLIPRIEKLVVANQIEAYNLPEGILTHLYRDSGAGKPGDLPVEQPTIFEFVVNMKTAKALGIKFSNSILVQVTKVIE